jgi:hypothetical protein
MGNGGKTIAVTAEYKRPKVSWYNDYYIGPERVDGKNLRRSLFDTTLVFTPLRCVSLDINLDSGAQVRVLHHTDNWIGVAGSAKVSLPHQFAVSPRWEWFSDPDGFTTGLSQTVHEFTLTGERALHKGVVARAEYRRDSSNHDFFDAGSKLATSKASGHIPCWHCRLLRFARPLIAQ